MVEFLIEPQWEKIYFEQFAAVEGIPFGVVFAWKVNLVQVPATVTFFNPQRPLEQNAFQLFNKWQYMANKLPDDITTYARVTNFGQAGNRTIVAQFHSLFLGGIDRLIPVMENGFLS